jgi:hypothetical protein
MGKIRRHRTLIGWIAIVALLSNVVAGLFCSAPSKAGPFDYPQDLLGAMVICTEHGVQMLASGDGEGGKAPGKPCQLCLAAAAIALLLVFVALGSLLPLPPSRRNAFEFVPTFAGGLRRAGLGSRAPPLPA